MFCIKLNINKQSIKIRLSSTKKNSHTHNKLHLFSFDFINFSTILKGLVDNLYGLNLCNLILKKICKRYINMTSAKIFYTNCVPVMD